MVLVPTRSSSDAVLAGAAGVPSFVQVDLNGTVLVPGGSSTVAVAAATSTNTVVKSSAGRLCRVLITASGAGSVTIYDNASTASGTVIGITPANPSVGTTYVFELPASNGITVAGSATLPGITVSYY